jgi:Zn-dependent metalloprotease
MKEVKKATIKQFISSLLSVVAALALFLSVGGQQPVAAQGSADDIAVAQCVNAPQATTSQNDLTGKVNFVSTVAGQPIHQINALAASVSPEVAARNYLAGCGSLFGLKNQASELTVKRQTNASAGRSVVRFQQVYRSIPVYSAEFVVQLDSSKNVLVANGDLAPDLAIDVNPSVSAEVAQQAAVALVAQKYKVDAAALKASAPALWIYSPALLSNAGAPALVWRMDVTPDKIAPIRELVLIDAHTGKVALNLNQVDDALNRVTYTMNNSTTGSGTLVCDESNPTCSGGDTDAVNAHVYSGVVYNYYATNFGRNSIDNAGMELDSYVHYDTGYCNAFWDSYEMVYGDGCFLVVDDVVGHEMTHGVTEHESGLVYQNQSGAINESMSDIFGEFIDLTDGVGNDDPSVRWQMGEDTTGGTWGDGALRDLKNPPAYDQPDRMGSPLYYYGTSDYGGVHTNSGVGNKAAYLITDGDTFNGYTVTGIGIAKAQQVYYEAQTNIMTPSTNYAVLANALVQACNNLIAGGITNANDCTQVTNATLATEMKTKIPTPISPSGAGSDTTPTFKWSRVAGATQYRFQVYKGAAVVYTKTAAAAACAGTTCSNTPAVALPSASYKWRVQALVSGVWQKYSPLKAFSISTGGIKAGYYSGTGVGFTVLSNLTQVKSFFIVVNLPGCGTYQITHTVLAPIASKKFSFGGSFYASGAFSSSSAAAGKTGLSKFGPICGYVWTGGPFAWSATWKHALQASGTAQKDGPANLIEPTTEQGAFTIEKVGP